MPDQIVLQLHHIILPGNLWFEQVCELSVSVSLITQSSYETKQNSCYLRFIANDKMTVRLADDAEKRTHVSAHAGKS